ncbi:MAG: sugar kinase [Phycisphaeraceae bacterium]|nr:sugar kinase [Phycisphaeraceae bacterium]
MTLIVTGTIGIDTIHAPTGSVENVLGGSCTYFAAAASFHGPVRIVAAAGDDLPDSMRATLASFKGLDTSGLEVRRNSKTFRWGGRYHTNMDRRDTLFTELGVLVEPPPPVPPAFADSQFVFLANSHPAVQLGFLERLPSRVLTVADTMDLWINTARPELDRLLKQIDGLVLNYDEAELLTGKRNPVTAARHMLDMGPSFVVIKKGEHGCLLVHKEGIGALPAYPAENVIDPTGAGDSFAGGMMGYIASQRARGTAPKNAPADDPLNIGVEILLPALAHGTVMASFTIEEFSLAGLSRLTRDKLDQRFTEYVNMLRIW